MESTAENTDLVNVVELVEVILIAGRVQTNVLLGKDFLHSFALYFLGALHIRSLNGGDLVADAHRFASKCNK